MRTRTYLVILFVLFSGLAFFISQQAAAQKAKQDRAEKAEDLFNQGMVLVQESLDKESLVKAIDLFEQAAKLDPSNEMIRVTLAKHYFFLGDYGMPRETRDQRQARLEVFQKGMAASEKAMQINPKSVGGIYWYTVNMASEGDMKGILSSLWMAGTLFGNMSRVDRRDPYYYYGATRRFGSEVFVRVPKFLTERFGFKMEYIEEDLLDNIDRWPDFFPNYNYLARAYVWNEQNDKALKLLEYVLTHDPEKMHEERAENKLQQKAAKEMWREITEKEFPNK